MRVYSLCSSSRAGSSYLISGAGGSILVDCGGTNRHLKFSLEVTGTALSSLVGCVISHSHPDHTASLPFLERSGLPLWARPETKRALEKAGRSKGGITPVPGYVFEVGEFRVRVFKVPHYSVDGSSCIHIESMGQSVAILTDAGDVPHEVAEEIRGARCVICESNHDAARVRSGQPFEGGRYRPLWVLLQKSLGPKGHLSNDKAATLLEKVVTANTRQVVLCHISEDYNRPDIARLAVSSRLCAKGWDGSIHIAPPDGVYGPLALTASG